MHLIGAVGEHQQQRGFAQLGDKERDEVEGRAVGPVQVLDDQHERLLRSGALEDTEHQLEQPCRRTRRCLVPARGGIELGQQPSHLSARMAKHHVEPISVE